MDPSILTLLLFGASLAIGVIGYRRTARLGNTASVAMRESLRVLLTRGDDVPLDYCPSYN